MMLAIVSHPDCRLHQIEDHPECPERVKVIQRALENFPFRVPIVYHRAIHATFEQLKLAHDAKYIEWLMSIAPKTGLIAIDADTLMNPHTLNAALYAAGSLPLAVDLVCGGKAKAAFCNVRPPGHHAERNKAMGFCFFNNVAVGVYHALEQYALKRIAIIDFDVHHGNGTQAIFQEDERVMYCSSFQHPFYPGYDPAKDNEHILSVPLPAGTSGQHFREKVKKAWFEKLHAFAPQLVFFSAGFDAHVQDPLANLGLQEEDYVWITQEMVKLASKECRGFISALEGGYDLKALATCAPAHANALVHPGR